MTSTREDGHAQMAESLQRDLTRQVERAKQFREDHQKVYYMHFRNGSQRGGLTLAIEWMDDSSYQFGIAVCSPEDQFCRRRGRDIARGRMRRQRDLGRNAHPLCGRRMRVVEDGRFCVAPDMWRVALDAARSAVFHGSRGGRFGYMLLSVFEDADRQLSGVKHVEA